MDILSGVKFVGMSLVIVLAFWAWNQYDELKQTLDSTRQELNVSVNNNTLLKTTINQQEKTIKKQMQEAKDIQEANSRLQATNTTLTKEYKNLDGRFNDSAGKQRDIMNIAKRKTAAVERVINRASRNAFRCAEIAMGATLTEIEINATKKSQSNPECPGIANPNYSSY